MMSGNCRYNFARETKFKQLMLLVELLVEPKSPPKALLLVEIWMHEKLHQKQKNGANYRFASCVMA